MTRQGPIYMYKRTAGPPPNDDLDRWIHKATQAFDLTPVMSGDQQQARWVAQDYFNYLKTQARRDGMDWKTIVARLKQVAPFLRRSLASFFTYYDAQARNASA